MFCLVHVLPVRGNRTTCVFPFSARGVKYDKCVAIIPGNTSLMCGTVSNTNQWGICIPGEWISLHCLYCKFNTLPIRVLLLILIKKVKCQVTPHGREVIKYKTQSKSNVKYKIACAMLYFVDSVNRS